MASKISDEAALAAVQAVAQHGTQAKAAEALGISQSMVSNRIAAAKARGLVAEPRGQVGIFESKAEPLPSKGKVTRYLLTCAQDRTRLHAPAWANLLALAEHYEAKILVSTFKYNKDAMGQRVQSKFETRDQELAALYAPEIVPYVCDDRIDLAPALTFCGELNVLPTAMNPLEGLEQYTYRKSTIVPHPKLALESVPTMRGEGVKLLYTTGCITQRNYIKRKVGYKAEHFHSYGALLVEVDANGSWWCRQVVHGPDGAMHDLNVRAIKGKIEVAPALAHPSPFVADITWGDIHADQIEPVVAEVSWGKAPDSLLNFLGPWTQHAHDLLDMGGRSHHMRKDPHAVFKSFVHGKWELTQELRSTAAMLWNDIDRPWCKTYVVNSNHDRHLNTFIKEVDWRQDPTNAIMILALNHAVLCSIRAGRDMNLLEHALRLGLCDVEQEHGPHREQRIFFLAEDESHVILPGIDGGIECGLHGDRGANGAKGTITGISKLDRKVNGADKHTVAIMNHAYFCGTAGKLEQEWNHGLSSWTHAHTVTYANGTRAIISIWKGKWRA